MEKSDLLIALVGGLLGSILGVIVSLGIEREAVKRQRQITLAGVIYELTALASTVEAALTGEQRKQELRAPLWETYGIQLVTYLPFHLFTAIWIIHDQFDRTREFYGRLVGEGIISAEKPGVEITLAGWAIRARLTVEAIEKERKPRFGFRWPWTKSADEKLEVLMGKLDKATEKELLKRGFDVDKFHTPKPIDAQ